MVEMLEKLDTPRCTGASVGLTLIWILMIWKSHPSFPMF
jgi:hypothetical protein